MVKEEIRRVRPHLATTRLTRNRTICATTKTMLPPSNMPVIGRTVPSATIPLNQPHSAAARKFTVPAKAEALPALRA